MSTPRHSSAATREALEVTITALANTLDVTDADAIAHLAGLVTATAKLADAQARFTEAMNQRHAQRRTAAAQ